MIGKKYNDGILADRVGADDIYAKIAELEDWLDEAVPQTLWLHEFLDEAQADVSALRRKVQKIVVSAYWIE